MDFQTELTRLNPQQREAVDTTQGTVLVIAGPGTGKTQVLAMRIANILTTTDTKASSILCLTFTESGVTAMRERLLQLIGTEAYYVRIFTFHGFCNEVIQSFPEKFAFARELVQLDDLGRIKIIRGILDGFPGERDLHLRPFYNRYQYQNDITSAIQKLKQENVSVDEFAGIAKTALADIEANPKINKKTLKPTLDWFASQKSAQRNVEMAEIYGLYVSAMQAAGYYDYEDMILFVISRMQSDPELLATYQERFLYILVDEYQDTNGSQNEIIRLLGSFDDSPNVFAVGDDDQAIYRFQGANVDNLLFFTQQFKRVKTIPVTTSYRSSQHVLDVADSLIAHNHNRLVNLIPGLEKKLVAGKQLTNYPVEVVETENQDAENRFVVRKIQELVAAGAEYKDIAVLYRRHADAGEISQAMLRAQIPITLAAGSDALDALAVHKLLTLLKVIDFRDKNRDRLLFEVLFYDFLGFDRLDVFKVTRMAADRQQSLFDILLSPELLLTAGVGDPAKLQAFAGQIVEWQEQAANRLLIQFVEDVGMKSGFTNHVFAQGDIDLESINAVTSFFKYVQQLNKQSRHVRLADMLADIKLLEENNMKIEKQELETNTDSVQLMTAHKAKGLEFKYVFIIKFTDGNWGGRSKHSLIKLPEEIFLKTKKEKALADSETEEDLQTEDERRLLFVALTRAKQRIYISYADEYPSGDSTKMTAPSQFLSELDDKLLIKRKPDAGDAASPEELKAAISPLPIPDYSAAEREYLLSLIADFRLSPTALNVYIECPLRFKFDSLLHVPSPRDKTQALGTAIHFALEHFYRQLKSGEMQDLQYLQVLFASELNRQLLDADEVVETQAEGTKIITDYYNNYTGSFLPPAEVEYRCSGRDIVLEHKGLDPIHLSGKLDRVDWIDKEHYTVKVVDYKTTTPKSANDIKGQTKTGTGDIWRQLVFYKLLGMLDRNFRPAPNLPKYNIESAEIDFLKPAAGEKFKRESFDISQPDVDELKALIADVMTRVRNLEFRGSEAYPLCGKCAYCEIFNRK